jgi:diaminopimelate decarboxylase
MHLPQLKPGVLFPATATINSKGHLEIGGCDVLSLVSEFGTPLYVFDKRTLEERCKSYLDAVATHPSGGVILYSAKAYCNISILKLVSQKGLGIDVVSLGELKAAMRANADPSKLFLFGNNKSDQEIKEAADIGAVIVVDGFEDIQRLSHLTYRSINCMVRINPGVTPDTHTYISTGQADSKFGFDIPSGAALDAISKLLEIPNVELLGLHCHIGSQIFNIESYVQASAVLMNLAKETSKRFNYWPKIIGLGGGLAIAYTSNDMPPSPSELVNKISRQVSELSKDMDKNPPILELEPGRSIVGTAGVALYTVGTAKNIPGVKTYIAVDGGMGDNIRPKLYGAKYEAFLANKMLEPPSATVTVAGKFCESTDILVHDVALPPVTRGDIIAIPAAGAYTLSMSSNYNHYQRPAAVMVADGNAWLIRKRESIEDILALDTT